MLAGKKKNPFLEELFRPGTPDARLEWGIDRLTEADPEEFRTRELALKGFCHETELHLSLVDLSGFSPEPFRSQWRAWGWGREMMELVGAFEEEVRFVPSDYSIPEEEAVRGHIRSFWRKMEDGAQLEPAVRRSMERKRLDVDRLAEVIKILDDFRSDEDDMEWWQLGAHARQLEPHLRADAVSSHITSLQDAFVPLLSRIHEEKRRALDALRGRLRQADSAEMTDLRRHLVARLLTVRKGARAGAVKEEDLWLVKLFEGQTVPCLAGPRLSMLHGKLLLETVLVLRRDKRVFFDGFLSFDDVALMLLALGAAVQPESSSEESSMRSQYQRLRQTVEEDWAVIAGALPDKAPLPFAARPSGIKPAM